MVKFRRIWMVAVMAYLRVVVLDICLDGVKKRMTNLCENSRIRSWGANHLTSTFDASYFFLSFLGTSTWPL
jgi:hypothetical protein